MKQIKLKYQKYPEYKDSGVEWLGEIPEGWEMKRLKYIIKIHSGNGFPVNEQGDKKGEIPFLKVSDINGKNPYISKSNNFVSKKLSKKFKWNIVPKNSIVTAKIGEALRKNHRKIITTPSIIDNNCIAFEPIDIKSKFNYYLHLIIDFDWFVNAGAVPSISVTSYKNNMVPLPPLPEQTAIAEFLDDKTAKIDRAIAQKEKLIALLKEHKQIIIQNAVTKGLNPDVKLKDSGVEWIGEIPENWEVKRLKYVGKIVSGYAFPSDGFKSNGVRVLKISNIQTMNIDWSDESYVDNLFYDKLRQFQIKEGDLVFALTRPIISTGIKASIVPQNDEKILLNQRNAVLKPNNPKHKHWLYFVILDSGFRQEFNNQIDFTGQQPNISPIDIGNLKIPLPPVFELELIVKKVELVLAKIDKAISLQQKQIEKLKEYKTVLIDSAVTGKIKVS